jgi:aminoglycoside phosphotransferase (APT) family kinase protein
VAAVSGKRRDLDAVAAGLTRWFTSQRDGDVTLSPLKANAASGYSSETLLFELTVTNGGAANVERLVVRLPPAGGGLFPEYELGRQAATQNLLADADLAVPAPAVFEADESWIGSPFLVMPQVSGRIPGDYVYLLKGWLKDASPDEQRACYQSYVDTMIALHRVEVTNDVTALLGRRAGVGLAAEIAWWSDYHDWATADQPDAHMAAAYRWVHDTAPADDALSITWGDPRFANASFDDDGRLLGAFDWEQAAVGPAELDIGWFFTCRRQVRDAFGIEADPELPGFLDRDATIDRIEQGLGRPLRDLEWHETFAAVRMGTCVVGIQRVLRRSGQLDHYLMQAPPLPPWALAAVGG